LLNYSNIGKTYAEVYDFLELLGYDYIKKIPSEIFNEIKDNRLVEYNEKSDIKIIYEKPNFKKETLAIIAFLDLNYWCNEEDKKAIQNMLNEKERQYEIEQRKLYNPDDIFKRNKTEKEKQEETAIIEYKKENFIVRFFNKIKKLFCIM